VPPNVDANKNSCGPTAHSSAPPRAPAPHGPCSTAAPAAPQTRGPRQHCSPWHITQPSGVAAHRHQLTLMWATPKKTRLWLLLRSFRPLSPPSGSSRVSVGCKHRGQCSGHPFCCEAFQVGAGVWKGSACCIRQLQPCKGQGCFGTEMFAGASPSPISALSITLAHSRRHTHTPLQPAERRSCSEWPCSSWRTHVASPSRKRHSCCAALPGHSAERIAALGLVVVFHSLSRATAKRAQGKASVEGQSPFL